ncbi:hypothetical protein L3Q82_012889, partial [Scortum barcoo]
VSSGMLRFQEVESGRAPPSGSGGLVAKRYSILQSLGRGSFGSVYLVQDNKATDGEKLAVVIFLDEVVKVERVVEAGIVLRYLLVNPSKKITVSNAPPFIKNGDLCKALSRRQLYMILKDADSHLNLTLNFKQETKGQRAVKTEQFFPDLNGFIRSVNQLRKDDVFSDQEIYRLRKLEWTFLPQSCRRAVITLLPKKRRPPGPEELETGLFALQGTTRSLSKALALRLREVMAEDQEKAFDRVEHQYLWKTLAAFGFSPGFIARIQRPSSLWHRLAVVDPPSNLLSRVQAILVNFFWDRLHWLPQAVLFLPKEEGGQGLVHLASRCVSFRLQFIQRLLYGPQDLVWRPLAQLTLQSVGGLGLQQSVFLMDFKTVNLFSLPVFYRGLFSMWKLLWRQGVQERHMLGEYSRGLTAPCSGDPFPSLIICPSSNQQGENNPASMDPADPGAITKALSAQGIIVGKHDSQIQEMVDTLRDLSNSMARMQTQLSLLTPGSAGSEGTPPGLNSSLAAGSTVSTPREPFVPTPESYAGDLGSCSRFLFQCSIVFVQQPSSYSSDNAKIGYVVNLLRGKASDWATALWQANSPVLQSFDSFIAEMKKVFDHPVQGQEAVKRLLDLRQGSQSVAAYSVDFRILAAASGWDSLALKGIFYKGLAEKIKDKLSLRDEPDSLDSLISLAIRIDNRPRERQRERGTLMPKLAQPASASPPLPLSFAPSPHSPPPVALPSVSEEPMQLGRAKLSSPQPRGFGECRFIVEVDASETGIGAVLSQRCPVDQKVHPCAFFSRRLTPAERNYDVGNRELLAVVLALQEWRHWLEGAEQPFLVWTDHKNLAYLRSAKRLNPRQARWALFLSRFEFTLTYRPGSHNTKPDALSRQFSLDTSPSEPASILPPSCIVGAASWDIETRVQEALKDHPAPNNCPKDRLFVPSNLRSLVLQWIHTSKFSCHPGIRRTLFLLQQRFWWPRMAQDTQEYINACSVCARGKSSHRAPAGFLKPLPIPHRPWSHIAVDFVSGLPPSQEVPSSLLRYGQLFAKHLVQLPSLSSGYHPQSNGQTERANQSLETALRCVAARNPASWSTQLAWVEYAHNSLSNSSTGMSPFMAANGFQPPLFPSQEEDTAVPSVQAHLRRCRGVWRAVRAALVRSSTRSQKSANQTTPPSAGLSTGSKGVALLP